MILDLRIDAARILTLDPGRPVARSLGVWGGRIVGLDDDLDGLTARHRVDVGDGIVVPGFHDGHCHTTSFGLGLVHLALEGCPTEAAVLDAVAADAAGRPGGAWVIGFGLDPGIAPGRDALDRAAGGRPVWLTHTTGHSCVVGGAALDRVGIVGALPEGSRGSVAVDGSGRPTGLLLEAAMDLVKDHVGPSSVAGLADAVDRATARYAAEGVTSFTDAGIGCPGVDHSPLELAAYQLARDTGRLRARACLMVHNELFHRVAGHADDRATLGLDLGLRTGFGDPWLSVGAMKVWVDGSGLGHTAATTGDDGSVEGAFDNDPALLSRDVAAARRAGWQVAAHCIGDAAVDLVLDALEAADADGPHPMRSGRVAPDRIEHGVMLRDDQLPRLAARGMAVAVQPLFVGEFGDPLLDLVGDGPASASFFRTASLDAAGILVVGSSDRPVAAGAPLEGIQAMVERSTASGRTFGAHERLAPAAALAAYTTSGARAAGWGHAVGALRPGLLADLVVLDGDPTAVDPAAIAALGVAATLVDGRTTHDRDGRFPDGTGGDDGGGRT